MRCPVFLLLGRPPASASPPPFPTDTIGRRWRLHAARGAAILGASPSQLQEGARRGRPRTWRSSGRVATSRASLDDGPWLRIRERFGRLAAPKALKISTMAALFRRPCPIYSTTLRETTPAISTMRHLRTQQLSKNRASEPTTRDERQRPQSGQRLFWRPRSTRDNCMPRALHAQGRVVRHGASNAQTRLRRTLRSVATPAHRRLSGSAPESRSSHHRLHCGAAAPALLSAGARHTTGRPGTTAPPFPTAHNDRCAEKRQWRARAPNMTKPCPTPPQEDSTSAPQRGPRDATNCCAGSPMRTHRRAPIHRQFASTYSARPEPRL